MVKMAGCEYWVLEAVESYSQKYVALQNIFAVFCFFWMFFFLLNEFLLETGKQFASLDLRYPIFLIVNRFNVVQCRISSETTKSRGLPEGVNDT